MPGGAVELDLAEAGIHMFVEKPVSIRSLEEVSELSKRLDAHHSQNGVIIGVGYMLRYAAAVSPSWTPRITLQQHCTRPDLDMQVCNVGHRSIFSTFLQTLACGATVSLVHAPARYVLDSSIAKGMRAPR